jgi:protein-tyrosine-phosphatase
VPSAPTVAPRVLFVCMRNSVRSPMAEGLLIRRRGDGARVASAGIIGDTIDPLATAVMEELGVDLSRHRGRALADLTLSDFDVVVSLSPEAAMALEPPPTGVVVEHWDIDDPTLSEGNRDMRLDAYRRVREAIERRIAHRFPAWAGKTP